MKPKRKRNIDKKGQVDIFFIMIGIFVIAITLFIAAKLTTEFQDSLGPALDNEESHEALTKTATAINNFDVLFGFIIVALI